MCSAWLSWRSPPRLSRCWVRLPEKHLIGAVPDCSAKLASERNRGLPAVWRDQHAAALFGEQLGTIRADAVGELALQRVELAVEAAQAGELFAGDADARAGRKLP
jgi:hypothetical protein